MSVPAEMTPLKKKISLVYYVLITLFAVGLVPLVITGWLLSERSAKEVRALEGRYQTQLVQDKARQIEMFGQRNFELVSGFAKAFELTQDFSLLSSPQTQQRLGEALQKNPSLTALVVRPVTGEPLSVYRTEILNEAELENLSVNALSKIGEKNFFVGKPQKINEKGEIGITIAVPVINGGTITAGVVGVISLREISRILSEAQPMSEQELWKSGLPILFVIDEQGRAVFHQDAKIVETQKTLNDLKIVQEWQQSGKQVQSALVPFTAKFEGEEHEMIGAYSTANINNQSALGVISMQNENKALASVQEMRRNTWIISLALAVIAVVIGSLFARQLTKPILSLVSAAEKFAQGDLSTRVKAQSFKEVETLGTTFNAMGDKLQEQIAQLAKAAEENRELFVGTVKALSAAIDGKDKYTRGHSERVARFSVAIGKELNLPAAELETLRISALLHDVGKIAIDDNILKKPSALTDEEFEIMKQHPQKGYKIMSQIPAMKDFLPGMYMHHEMINGMGYPQGLKGHQIPLQAKIVSVADTFDAMTTDRPYQKGMQLEIALERIKTFVGTRYEPKVVEALINACADGKIRPVSAAHPNRIVIPKDNVTEENSEDVEIEIEELKPQKSVVEGIKTEEIKAEKMNPEQTQREEIGFQEIKTEQNSLQKAIVQETKAIEIRSEGIQSKEMNFTEIKPETAEFAQIYFEKNNPQTPELDELISKKIKSVEIALREFESVELDIKEIESEEIIIEGVREITEEEIIEVDEAALV